MFCLLYYIDVNFEFAIVHAYEESGQVDPNGAQTMKNASTAGMSYADGYITPCLQCGKLTQQVLGFFFLLELIKLTCINMGQSFPHCGLIF